MNEIYLYVIYLNVIKSFFFLIDKKIELWIDSWIFHPQLMDANKDGVVTIEELVQWCSKDEQLLRSLDTLDTVLWDLYNYFIILTRFPRLTNPFKIIMQRSNEFY